MLSTFNYSCKVAPETGLTVLTTPEITQTLQIQTNLVLLFWVWECNIDHYFLYIDLILTLAEDGEGYMTLDMGRVIFW